MMLPFRRRHNDHEASHDRARGLIATGFTQPIEPGDVEWLDAHLAGCAACTGDARAYAADREQLRALRDQAPTPPRDLWARTAAAIEREDSRRDGAGNGREPRAWRPGRVPLGVASGLLVIAVVVGVSLAPQGLPLIPATPPGSDAAVATPVVEATPIVVTANALAWIQAGPNGSYEFRRATLDSVCPDVRSGCAPLETRMMTRLALTQPPQAVVQSPSGTEIVVVTSPDSVGGAGVVVVPVPTTPPDPLATPSVPPPPSTGPESTGPESAPPTPAPPTPAPTAPPSLGPAGSPSPQGSGEPTASVEPTPTDAPVSGHAIASGVLVVGDTAYSPDGQWLAFSARPADGSSGPDLYLWRVGDPLAAAVTADHRTFFAGWLGNQILANTVLPAIPADGPAPGASIPVATGSTAPLDLDATSDGSPAMVEEHPIAFILDPETMVSTVLAAQDMWHPTVDPTGRSVVYWAGTVVPDETGMGWNLGTGQLVIDGWLGIADGSGESGGPAGNASPSPEATVAGDEPALPEVGPAGHPVALSGGPGFSFDVWFDPSGLRFAVWFADPADPTVGTLRLVVLDEETLQIDGTNDPLPGVAALRGVSINEGRLAWVTPPGQDGEGSHVQVLGWHGRNFGQVRTIQAERLFVVR